MSSLPPPPPPRTVAAALASEPARSPASRAAALVATSTTGRSLLTPPTATTPAASPSRVRTSRTRARRSSTPATSPTSVVTRRTGPTCWAPSARVPTEARSRPRRRPASSFSASRSRAIRPATLTEALKARPEELPERVAGLMARLRDAEKELAGLRRGRLLASVGILAEGAQLVGPVRLVTNDVGDVAGVDDLRALVLEVRARLGEAAAVVAVGGVSKERPVVLVATNAAARDAGLRAGSRAKAAATVLGGGGGGKDDIAQGGGNDVMRLAVALDAVRIAVGAAADAG